MPPVLSAWYPHARYDRDATGALGFAGLAGGAIPRTRVFPFYMNATVNARKTISMPLVSGPAILRKLTFEADVMPDPPVMSLEIGYSLIPVLENAVPLVTARPYTLLTELQDPFTFASVAGGQGLNMWTFPNGHTPWEMALNLLVMQDRFCFTVSFVNNSGSGDRISGRMTVVEGIAIEALPGWLGA